MTSANNRRSTVLMRSCRVDSSSPSSTGTGSCARIGPVSTPASTRCDGRTRHLHAVRQCIRDRVRAGKCGQQRGMRVDDATAEAVQEGGTEDLHESRATRPVDGWCDATASVRATSQAAAVGVVAELDTGSGGCRRIRRAGWRRSRGRRRRRRSRRGTRRCGLRRSATSGEFPHRTRVRRSERARTSPANRSWASGGHARKSALYS